MMRKRIRMGFGVIFLLACLCCFSLTALAVGGVGYYVDGQYDGENNLLTLEIGVENVADAGVGRFALAFDRDKLNLLEKQGQNYVAVSDSFSYRNVVTQSSVATVTAETLSPSQLVSVKDGYVMFAWYATGSKVNASSNPQAIATMHFSLKDGVSIEDLDRGSFRLKNVRSLELANWDSAAVIKSLADGTYSHNTLGGKQCEIRFDYPNCKAVPQNACDVVFRLRDSGGQAVKGGAYIGSDYYAADNNGNINAEVAADSYAVKIEASGYETKIDDIEAHPGSKLEKEYVLRSDKEYLTMLADSLVIGYSEGDSADGVRGNLQLPRLSGNDVLLTWSSSNRDVLTASGAVARPGQNTSVTLTATLTKGSTVVERTFSFTVLARGVLIGSTTNPGEVIIPGENKTPGQTGELQSKFQDLANVPWAVSAINGLVEQDIIKGVSDTRFAPLENISRGDFMVLVVRMFEPDVTITDNFSDVSQGSYYYNEIARAKAWGIAKGNEDGTFHPQSPISRQDMMTIMYRALLDNKVITKQANTVALAGFADKNMISAYAEEAVGQLVAAGLIQGSGNQIQPLAQTTRAEAAVFLYRIYNLKNK